MRQPGSYCAVLNALQGMERLQEVLHTWACLASTTPSTPQPTLRCLISWPAGELSDILAIWCAWTRSMLTISCLNASQLIQHALVYLCCVQVLAVQQIGSRQLLVNASQLCQSAQTRRRQQQQHNRTYLQVRAGLGLERLQPLLGCSQLGV